MADDEVKEEKKKLYKGELMPAADLAKQLKTRGVVPVQAPTRKFKLHNFEHQIPPTFLVTKFAPGYGGALTMHFFSKGQKMYREVPQDLELNVLSGRRAEELNAEWATAVDTRLSEMTRRIACSIGTDPEIFVADSKGRLLPAFDFLPGKDSPAKWASPDNYFKGTYYWDGFQAEFTTPGNLTCLAQMTDCIHHALRAIHTTADKKYHGARLLLDSVVQVSDKVLHDAKPEHVAFGCAPSKNVYGLKGNSKEGREVGYRFSGGHIHLGLTDYAGALKTPEDKERVVRVLDSILGVAAVSLFAGFDNPVRRQYYGQPGEYRLPPHGLEYRVLSNAWLTHPLITHMVFDLCRAAIGLLEEGFAGHWKAEETEVVETIMNHEVDRARAILKRNEKVFRAVLKSIGGAYFQEPNLDVAMRIWTTGMESAIEDPKNIEKNWALKVGSNWVNHSEGANSYFARAVGTLSKGKKV